MRGGLGAKPKTVPDKILLACVLTLSLFGLLMQFSAGSYSAMQETGDAFAYVKRQAAALAFALALFPFVCRIDTGVYYKLRHVLFVSGLVLLALVFVPGVGVENYGATRWINLGFTTFQPSDIAKFTLTVFIAGCLSRKSAVSFASMAKILLACAATCALIMAEPNMSITMCVGLVTLVMLFVGGAKPRHFALLGVPALALVVALIAVEPYRLKRIAAFLDPWSSPLGEGYQLIQSYYALGAGGLFGVGLFNSRQKYLFLPFAESDFIFSVVGEELGFFGCVAVLALFGVLVWRGVLIAVRAQTRFDCNLAAGITAVIGVQALLNVAVVTGTIPPTGLPLPYVSAGGTSLLMFVSAAGVLEKIASKSQSVLASHKMY